MKSPQTSRIPGLNELIERQNAQFIRQLKNNTSGRINNLQKPNYYKVTLKNDENKSINRQKIQMSLLMEKDKNSTSGFRITHLRDYSLTDLKKTSTEGLRCPLMTVVDFGCADITWEGTMLGLLTRCTAGSGTITITTFSM